MLITPHRTRYACAPQHRERGNTVQTVHPRAMKHPNVSLRAARLALTLSALTSFSPLAGGSQPLFLEAGASLQTTARPAVSHAARSRVVRLNANLLRSASHGLRQVGLRFAVELFDGRELEVVVERVDIHGPDRFVSIGRVEGVPSSAVILASTDGVVAGSVSLPGEPPYAVQFAGEGLHRLNEIDTGKAGRCAVDSGVSGPPAFIRQESPNSMQSGAASTLSPRLMTTEPGGEPEPVMIDFLLLYTPRALAGAGGEAGIQAVMDFAVAQANACYANSKINIRWNVVYQGLVNYTESGALCSDKDWLMNNAAALRNAYKADLAMLIVESDDQGYAGCATGWGTAFVRNKITVGYLVAHEVGHLLGAGHDRLTCRNQPDNCGAKYPYSYGHRLVADGVTYTTVMAYEPGLWIPYFSNPDVLFRGVPTGVPAGQPDAADNARTFAEFAPQVARFMTASNRFDFGLARHDVAESASSLSVEVVRSGNLSGSATVEVVTLNGTATSGQDFLAATNTLAFAPGETRKLVPVTLLDDSVSEGAESLMVGLRRPQAGTALGPRSAVTVTIQDDESYFHFETAEMRVPENNGPIPIAIHRGGDRSRAEQIGYRLVAGTAQSVDDFVPASGILEFTPDQVVRRVSLNIVPDAVIEPDEDLVLELTRNSEGSVVTLGRLGIKIADDDRFGTLAESRRIDVGPWGTTEGGSWANSVVVDNEGRILAGGRFTDQSVSRPPKIPTSSVHRLSPDGEYDSSFRPAYLRSTLTAESLESLRFVMINSILIQPDGRIVVGGDFATINDVLRPHIARLNSDGSLDPTFAPAMGPDSEVGEWTGLGCNAMALQPDGKILIAGQFWSVNGVRRGVVARLNPDGSLDTSFAPRPDEKRNGYSIVAVAVQPDGRILVGGNGIPFEGGNAFLSRLNPDGSRDRTFRGAPGSGVNAVKVLPDGKILIGGVFNTPRARIARLMPDGVVDGSFRTQPAPNNIIHDLAVQADGRVLIVGGFTAVGGKGRKYVARLNADGSLDETFDPGPGPNDLVMSVALDPTGAVLLAGRFTSFADEPAPYVVRLRSDGTRPVLRVRHPGAGGERILELLGNAGRTYVFESSVDLSTWTAEATNTLRGTSWPWAPSDLGSAERWFYRARHLSE